MNTKRDFQRIEAKHDALVEAYAYVRNDLGVGVNRLVRDYQMNKGTLARLRRGEHLERAGETFFVQFVRIILDQIRVREMKGQDVSVIRTRLLELMVAYYIGW